MYRLQANPPGSPVARFKIFCAIASTVTLLGCSALPQVTTPAPRQADPVVAGASATGPVSPHQPIDTKVGGKQPVAGKNTLKSADKAINFHQTERSGKQATPPPQIKQKPPQPKKNDSTAPQAFQLPELVIVDKVMRTGHLENLQLNEVSGMSASRNSPGVLYAINDSGNEAILYALDEKGQHISHWAIRAPNVDWEDLGSVEMNNQRYVVIGDTGDNLRTRRSSTLYLVAEPTPGQPSDGPLIPHRIIDFTYEDGPRNVEALAVHGLNIYLISKEPLGPNGATASRLYTLRLPLIQPSSTLTARFVTQLRLPRASLESKLAASFAGVDLDHITAMDMTASGQAAYLLTYREVHKIERGRNQSWSNAFQNRGTRIHTHNLGQAEALAIAPGRSVFITSEKRGAPLWSIPIQATP